MIRPLAYAAAVLGFAAAVVFRAGVAEQDAKREVVSIAGEWTKHGKPVDVHTIAAAPLTQTTKVSGVVQNNGKIAAYVTPTIVKKIHPGQSFDGCGARPLSGEIAQVAAAPDLATGLHQAVLTAHEGASLPGAIIVACVRSAESGSVLLIPGTAVRDEKDDRYAWLVRDGRAGKRKLELGESNERYFRVRSGLARGDVVVIDGWRNLAAGDPVRIREGAR
ncbi:MAG: hypothetical protein ABIJ96_01330 [Elusimicrobiota bacterium]